MEWIHFLFASLIGLCLGSFCSVLVCRIPEGRSVLGGRSRCVHCPTALRWYELIPVISFVLASVNWSEFALQKASCRKCKGYISWGYPARELWMAGMCIGIYLSSGWSWVFCRYVLLALLLTAIAEIDFRHGIVPNQLIIAGSLVALVIQAIAAPGIIPDQLLAAALSLALLLLIREGSIRFFGRAGLGMGDVKLVAMIALFIGMRSIWAFYLATVMGGIVGLIGVISGKWSRSTHIPFVPFIAMGVGWAAFLLPEDVLNWWNLLKG